MIDEFIVSFTTEANELLLQLENDLIQLEKQPEDREITDNIFRIMHNLKGAASMFGFEEMQYLTHEFENIFDQIRTGMLKVTKDLIDDTLKGKDVLLAMLDKEVTPQANNEFIARIASRYSCGQTDSCERIENNSEFSSDQQYQCILFSPEREVFERGLNPEKLIDEISEKGQAKIIVHTGNSPWEVQKHNKECLSTWEIYLKTQLTAAELEDIFLFYDNDEYKVFEIRDDCLEMEPAYIAFIKRQYGSDTPVALHIKECLMEINKEEFPQPLITPEKDPGTEVSGRQTGSSKPARESTLNVSSHKLDELMNLVSELVISTAALEAHAARLKDLKLNNHIENIEKLTKKFRNNALALRLIPVSNLLNRFNRQVRELCTSLNKEVTLIVEGQETEIDKTVLKSIESPLMHIIRNCIDHGIESQKERLSKGKSAEGMLKIAAFYSGANVIIQVHDDGRGIDIEKIRDRAVLKGYVSADQPVTDQELLNLIMEPGFTTSDNVSMVSGRGVGMDVVRKELNAIGGSLEIETEKNLGTSITMKLPTTLSIIDTLMLEVNEVRVLVPLLEVEYCYREGIENIYGGNSSYLNFKNSLVPFVSLRQKFNIPRLESTEEMVVIINKFDKKYAIVVDDIIGEQQAVIKPLGELFVNQPYFSGGSILVDGNLAFVLDTNYLFYQSVVN